VTQPLLDAGTAFILAGVLRAAASTRVDPCRWIEFVVWPERAPDAGAGGEATELGADA
jgi:hypothetical protein